MEKLKKLWDNYKEVAEVQKNERLKFVIAVGARDGFRCISIREFYLAKREGVWKPGRDGILIPLVSPDKISRKPDPNNPPKMLHPMKGLLDVLPKVMEEASALALEDASNAMWIDSETKKILKGSDINA